MRQNISFLWNIIFLDTVNLETINWFHATVATIDLLAYKMMRFIIFIVVLYKGLNSAY